MRNELRKFPKSLTGPQDTSRREAGPRGQQERRATRALPRPLPPPASPPLPTPSVQSGPATRTCLCVACSRPSLGERDQRCSRARARLASDRSCA